jgi:hypothetical protein
MCIYCISHFSCTWPPSTPTTPTAVTCAARRSPTCAFYAAIVIIIIIIIIIIVVVIVVFFYFFPAVERCGFEIKGPSCLEPQELSLVPLFCHALFVFSDSSIFCL